MSTVLLLTRRVASPSDAPTTRPTVALRPIEIDAIVEGARRRPPSESPDAPEPPDASRPTEVSGTRQLARPDDHRAPTMALRPLEIDAILQSAAQGAGEGGGQRGQGAGQNPGHIAGQRAVQGSPQGSAPGRRETGPTGARTAETIRFATGTDATAPARPTVNARGQRRPRASLRVDQIRTEPQPMIIEPPPARTRKR